MCAPSEHTQQNKKTKTKRVRVSVESDSVWVCSCVGLCAFLCFCDSRFPAVKSRSSFSLVPSFHTLVPPSFFFLYTHSSSPPSLLAQRWIALSLWWVTDEWSSALKSRVTARLVKREAMSDKRWQREEGERKEGREGGRGERGYIQTRENVKQWTSIKSARDGGWMCVAGKKKKSVWEGEQGLNFCMSASGYLHCGAQHAKGQHHASGK